jgi:hypothetical protein
MVVGLGEVYGGNKHDADGGMLRMSFAFSTHRGRGDD